MREIRGKLLRWYRHNRRDLPWRRTHDPYAIWVSEVMLQQTRVAVVVPYYERFLARFPDVFSLSRASEEEVLSLWSGLGYYRRARALREGARAVVLAHAGRVPRTIEDLLALPGVGRYTAGAIASVAFDLPEPILDGNVRRVLARLQGTARPRDAALWKSARELVHGPSPGDLNQALMELGATVCTPENPRCAACPVSGTCIARARGKTGVIPASRKRPPAERTRVAVALVEVGERLLLERRHAENPLRGTWELPAIEIDVRQDARAALRQRLARSHALTVRVGAQPIETSHAILNRRLAIEAYTCRILRGRVEHDLLRAVAVEELHTLPVSGATKKILSLQERLRALVAESASSHSPSPPCSYAAAPVSRSGSSARRSR